MYKEITLNEVKFTVSAQSVGDGFYGSWTCLECGANGSSNHKDSSEDAAIAAVQIGASLHTIKHKKETKDPK